MAIIKNLTAQDFEETLEKGVVLLDFWATWCNPCRMLGAILEKTAAAAPAEVVIGKVNVDEEPELAARYGVTTIPHLFLCVNGKVVNEMSGVQTQPKLLEAIAAAVEKA